MTSVILKCIIKFNFCSIKKEDRDVNCRNIFTQFWNSTSNDIYLLHDASGSKWILFTVLFVMEKRCASFLLPLYFSYFLIFFLCSAHFMTFSCSAVKFLLYK